MKIIIDYSNMTCIDRGPRSYIRFRPGPCWAESGRGVRLTTQGKLEKEYQELIKKHKTDKFYAKEIK